MNLITEEKAKWSCFIGMTLVAVLLTIFVFFPREDTHSVIAGQQIFETTYNNTIIQPVEYHTTEITSTAGAPGKKVYCNEWNDNIGKMMCKGSDNEWHCYERDGDRYARNFTTIELPWNECKE